MPGLVPPSLTVACRVRLVDGWHHRCGRARSAFRFVGVIVASLHIVGDVHLCGVLRTNEEGARGENREGTEHDGSGNSRRHPEPLYSFCDIIDRRRRRHRRRFDRRYAHAERHESASRGRGSTMASLCFPPTHSVSTSPGVALTSNA